MLSVRFPSAVNIDKRSEGHERVPSTRRRAKREGCEYAWREEEETVASRRSL